MSRGKRRQWPKLREGQRLHLEDLNADCILEIIWCLRNFDATRKKGQFSGVVALSMCSKKLRAVVGSLMRREVVLSHKLPAGGLLPSCRYPLDALRVVEYILESVEEAEKTTPTLKLAIVFNTSWGRQPNVVESIQKALCGTLRSFKTLETLEIELAPRSWLRDCLELAMRDSPFEMPTVKTLSLGPGCGFMFPVCPKVETVAVAGSLEHYGRKICSQHVYEAITAAAKCPNLEGFKVTQWWSLTTMEEIHRQLPGLKLLVLGTRYREIEAMQEMTREVLFPLLSQMKSLRKFAVPARLMLRKPHKGVHAGAVEIFELCSSLRYLCYDLGQRWVFRKDETGTVSDIYVPQPYRKDAFEDYWGIRT